jgi:hypothetical protein
MKKPNEYISSAIKLTPNFKEKLTMIWSHKFALLGIILSIFAVIVATKKVQEYQSLKTNAAASPAEIFFNPSTDTVTTTEKVFPVWINSSSVGVSFAVVELTFDPATLVLTKDPTPVNPVLTQAIGITTAATANSTGKISITLGQAPETATPSGAFQLVTLTFKAKNTTTSTSSVAIDLSNSQLINNSAVSFALSATPLSLSLNPVVTASGASLFFSTPVPANPQIVGTPFTTNIMMNTASQDTYGVDAVVKYDATKLKLTLITPISGNGFSSYPLSTIDNTAGVAKFSANIGSSATAAAVNGSNINIAKLTFTPLASTASVNLTYDFTAGNRNDSNVIFKNSSATQDPLDILTSVSPLSVVTNVASSPSPAASPSVAPSPSASPSVAPSPSASPSPVVSPSPSPSAAPTAVNISFSFSFQGKTRAEAAKNMAITFSYKKDGQTTPTVLNLTTDTTGKVITPLLPGNYVFLVKSSGYLARRFASAAAPITIGVNTSSIDFTNSPLLGGDLNGDKTVNEVDYTLKFLPPNIFGTADLLADLDSSGQVNNLDFGIMRGNWNLTDDTFQ